MRDLVMIVAFVATIVYGFVTVDVMDKPITAAEYYNSLELK